MPTQFMFSLIKTAMSKIREKQTIFYYPTLIMTLYQNKYFLHQEVQIITQPCLGPLGLQQAIVGNQPILCYINWPMFGFQSLLSTVWYCIRKGIIWTSTLRILVSLFDIPSLFDTSSLIDIFLRLSPIYWLVCLQRRENYSQLSYNLFHP